MASLERGSIELRRTYSGTLEAPARFVVAPKIGGRLEKLHVGLGDPVGRGQLVAELEDDELRQLAVQSYAELVVARANLGQAKNALEVASRELERIETLRKRGVASESQLDVARAERLARHAEMDVATAQVTRAEAAHEAARLRLGYTKITAEWSGSDEARVVSERFVSAGALIKENEPVLAIVMLDMITCVIFVAEKDYRHLVAGQVAELATDAYAEETFEGKVARIAPVFEAGSRQARVELEVDNKDRRLKPGMFARATIVLLTAEDALIAPTAAITTRDEETGIFLVDEGGSKVAWQTVRLGIKEHDRVQILEPELSGQVVTLGQQLLGDGSAITIPDQKRPESSER